MADFTWPDLFFIRHGQTDWNAERRYQGQRDIPLNRIGQGQADANGRALADYLEQLGTDPATLGWYVSPLGRARETMTRIRASLPPGLPEPLVDDRLMEISFGTLEGRLHSEIAAGMAVAPGDRDEAYWHFRPESGESYDDLEQRLLSFGRDLSGPAVVVSHGGVLRVLRHLIAGASRHAMVNWPPPQDVVLHFEGPRMITIGDGKGSGASF